MRSTGAATARRCCSSTPTASVRGSSIRSRSALRDEFHPFGVDVRGHGESERPADLAACTFPNVTGDVLAVLDALGFDEIVALGHSMGGAVAILLDELRPGIVRKALLCEAIAFPPGGLPSTATGGPNPMSEIARVAPRGVARPRDGARVVREPSADERAGARRARRVRAVRVSRPRRRPGGARVRARGRGAVLRGRGRARGCARTRSATSPNFRGALVVASGDHSNLPGEVFAAQARPPGAPYLELDGSHFFPQEDTARHGRAWSGSTCAGDPDRCGASSPAGSPVGSAAVEVVVAVWGSRSRSARRCGPPGRRAGSRCSRRSRRSPSGARHHRFGVTAGWFVVGSVARRCHPRRDRRARARRPRRPPTCRATPRSAILAVLALVAAAVDGGVFGFRPPFFRRQVNEDWLPRYRGWLYGVGFGWQVGVGRRHLHHDRGGVPHRRRRRAHRRAPGRVRRSPCCSGLVRGLTVFLTAKVHTPAQLVSFHRRFDAWGEPDSPRRSSRSSSSVALCAAGVAWGVVGLVAVAGARS